MSTLICGLETHKGIFPAKIIIFITGLLLAFACRTDSVKADTNRPPVVGHVPHDWEMVTDGKGVQLDLSRVERKGSGKLDADDEEIVLALASRVKGIHREIVQIVALGDTFYTPAVTVIDTSNKRVYLVHLENRKWDVSYVKTVRY